MKKIVMLLCLVIFTGTLFASFSYAQIAPNKRLLNNPILLVSHIKSTDSYTKNSTNLLYLQSVTSLTPSALNIENKLNNFAYTQQRVADNHNYFFEFSIIFNDKLQQLIAFFNCHSSDSNIKTKKQS